MAEKVSSKKGRKIGRNKEKCARYIKKRKKFLASKEHRGCGPLGYYMKRRAILDALYGEPKGMK